LNPYELLNYKGNLADDKGKTEGVRYTDPLTGAHFNFQEMCEKLETLSQDLAELEDKAAAVKHEATKSEAS
jgi:hypothetical protein